MKFFAALATAAALALPAAHAQDKPATAGTPDTFFADPVIVRGTGIEIRQSRLDEAVASVKAGAFSRNETISPADMPQLQKRVVAELLMNMLLNGKATDAEKAKGKEEGDKRFEMTRKRSLNEESFARQLKALGLTPDLLHKRLIEEATAETVLRAGVKVTDDEVKKYYTDNPDEFQQPEMVRVNHILLLTSNPRTGETVSEDARKSKRKLIEELLKRAKGGEEFSKLAKEYSEDPNAKETGGESTLPREGAAPVEFAAAAFSLKTNQISDVVTTSLGYHIIKLNEKIPAKKYDFEKVKEYIQDKLARRKMADIAPATFVSLRKEAKVEILDSQLKSMIDADDAAAAQVTNKAAPK